MPKGITQPDWLMSAAHDAPDAPALLANGDTLTYAEFDAAVTHEAMRLAADGVRAGMRIGVLLPNTLDGVVLLWALWRLGATVVLLNRRLTDDERAWQVAAAGCEQVIETPSREGRKEKCLFKRLERKRIEKWKQLSSLFSSTLLNKLFSAGTRPVFPAHEFEFTRLQIAAILFTSGTSGRPKGVQLTFNNLYYAAMASTLRLGNAPNDRWLLTLPLYHVGGLSILVRAVLCRASVVLHDGFDVDAVFRALMHDRITLVSLVPTMLYRLLRYQVSGIRYQQEVQSAEYKVQSEAQDSSLVTRHSSLSAENSSLITHHSSLKKADTSTLIPDTLRLILLGGAAASAELLAEAAARGIPVAPTYGLTEAGSQVATMMPDEARHKPGSVGKALPFMRLRVVDADGNELPPNEPGEIVVYGPNVMWGYLGEAHNIPLTQWGTPARLPYQEGFRTGDIGYLDEDGDLFVLQRRSDLIVTGGENVYPAEVERMLRQHPDVAEVCVVGIADAEWGQRVGAMVVLRYQVSGISDQESAECKVQSAAQNSSLVTRHSLLDVIERFARERLAGYKVPRVWRIVDALPLTAAGKVDRAAVARRLGEG
jgi:O-succinylbenzoic acid--CoA ligase